MAGENSGYRSGRGGTQRLSISRGWDTEKWVALYVVAALALLIAIRMGFRGVNLLGVSASVS
jgi:hypothetical protein